MKKLILAILVCCALHSSAQYPKVEIPGSEVRTMKSSIVEGQEYELHILLPNSYKTGARKYPVVYLMDSQWDFPLVKSIYAQQYYDGFIPELIIVGVTWGGPNANADSLRVRDYTPTKSTGRPQSGGADKFLSFMKEELFPFIESNYKADATDRSLMGCSLGGLFTLYALFTQPELFKGYAAASPAIGWDREILSSYEKTFADKKSPLPARAYLTIGDVESGRPSFEKFASVFSSRKNDSVQVISKVLENTGHSGTKSETYSRGLQFIFKRPSLQLSQADLLTYVGTYQFENGQKVEIVKQSNQLVLQLNPNNKFNLEAASRGSFYSTAQLLNVSFYIDQNVVKGLNLERYGSIDYLKRIN